FPRTPVASVSRCRRSIRTSRSIVCWMPSPTCHHAALCHHEGAKLPRDLLFLIPRWKDERVKVSLVCDWYHPRLRAIELHPQDLAARLDAAGHDVVVITPTPGAPQVNGIRVRRIDAPRAPVFGFLMTPGGVRALGDVLESERPDVAHCHVSIVSPAAL